jgi:hypothetical protein
MKRSDTTMDAQTGKFIARATPLGTVTEGMVIKRAKEIAVTNGRNGNDYTQNDLDEARRELVGFPDTDAADLEASAPDTGGWLGEAGDRGDAAPVRPAKDEQTFAEDLVKQGVDEATHHQMLVGNQTSREEDEA